MTRVLVLHAYSRDNFGDGLLVDRTLEVVRAAFGDDADIVLAAHRPETFADLGIRVLSSAPGRRGWSGEYLRALWRAGDADVVVAVGGGYLRAGTAIEAAKTTLVHGPQLLASAFRARRAVYLPQSVGPVRFGLRPLAARLLGRAGAVLLRDDRSMAEFSAASPERMPDLAALDLGGPSEDLPVDPVPVLSVRAVHGTVAPGLFELSAALGEHDGYIQSTTGGNDDRPATARFSSRRVLERNELLGADATPRVVVAVRLHAALMALRAGHYVVHLAYERKGFGAFGDLGLDEHVHSVNTFDVQAVAAQVEALLTDPAARAAYRERIARSAEHRAAAEGRLVEVLRGA